MSNSKKSKKSKMRKIHKSSIVVVTLRCRVKSYNNIFTSIISQIMTNSPIWIRKRDEISEITPFIKEDILNTTLEQRITYSIGELINRFSTF